MDVLERKSIGASVLSNPTASFASLNDFFVRNVPSATTNRIEVGKKAYPIL